MAFVEEIIKRFIEATRAKNQQEMLDIAGFSLGLASKWKNRGIVPDKSIAKVSEVTGVPFRYLKTGEGEMPPSHPTHTDPHLGDMADKALAGITFEDKPLSTREKNALKMLRKMEADQERCQEVYDRITQMYLAYVEKD